MSCRKDICDAFANMSFDDIWEMNTRLRDLGNIRLLKIRIQNSGQHLSSADGFRLIVCCNKKLGTVNLLNIYPKRGKLGLLNQPKEEYKRQLEQYAYSLQKSELIEHNGGDGLKEIRPETKA